jgi:hypothetical protein
MTLLSPELAPQAAQRDIQSYESLDALSIMIDLYRASRRNSADLRTSRPEVPDELRTRSQEGRQRVALPAPLTQSSPLSESLLARTSIRFYDDRAVGLEQMATILHVASSGDRQDWLAESAAGIDLQLFIVAWRVENLAPAVYRYEPDEHALSYVGPAPDQQAEGTNLVLQTEFAAAPIIVFLTGNLAAASARHGAWGHRQLLLRAGSAGHRLWLASLGVGLVGTVFAGFLPRAAQRIAGVDGYINASLLAYSTGYLHPNYIR